jgi:hypothetical protein
MNIVSKNGSPCERMNFTEPPAKALIVACLLLSSGIASAQSIFINDATLHTMGSQAVMQNADILLRDGLIRDIGPDLAAPADASVIEAGGRPVTPGFFAGISALGLEEISLAAETVDHGLQLESLRPEFDVTTAFNPYSAVIPVTRIEGYTWSLPGARRSGSIVGGQGRAVTLDGAFDTFLGDPVMFIDVGSDASGQSGGSRAAQWMLLNQAMDESRSALEWTPDPLLTPAGRKVMAIYAGGGTVVFDVNRASDILQVLAFSSEHGMNPVIAGGAEAWMVAEQLAQAGVPVLLDPLANLPRSFDSLGARLDNAAILNDAGVTISFIADDQPGHNARKLRQAAGVAVAYGLPFEAALAGLTINPAEIFSLGGIMGSLEQNKRGDLVIWSGDPLEVTTVAEQVFIDGKAVPMVSRQTMLRDRYLPQDPELPRAYIKP